jgi:hypothetical protein
MSKPPSTPSTISLVRAQQDGLIDALAQVANNPDRARAILVRAGFPDINFRGNDAFGFWLDIARETEFGRYRGVTVGNLVRGAAEVYPGHAVFARLAELLLVENRQQTPAPAQRETGSVIHLRSAEDLPVARAAIDDLTRSYPAIAAPEVVFDSAGQCALRFSNLPLAVATELVEVLQRADVWRAPGQPSAPPLVRPASSPDTPIGQRPAHQADAGLCSPTLSDGEFREWGVLGEIAHVFRREHLTEIDAMLDRLGCDPAKLPGFDRPSDFWYRIAAGIRDGMPGPSFGQLLEEAVRSRPNNKLLAEFLRRSRQPR